jgi:hypothetical protein
MECPRGSQAKIDSGTDEAAEEADFDIPDLPTELGQLTQQDAATRAHYLGTRKLMFRESPGKRERPRL